MKIALKFGCASNSTFCLKRVNDLDSCLRIALSVLLLHSVIRMSRRTPKSLFKSSIMMIKKLIRQMTPNHQKLKLSKVSKRLSRRKHLLPQQVKTRCQKHPN